MDDVALILGTVFTGAAALVHVYIWMLESVLWDRESTRRIFRVRTDADVETLRPMAYNQGYYNLFLALGVGAGLTLAWTSHEIAGLVLAVFAGVCMVLAALVLVTSNRRMLRAALIQGALPLVGIVLLVLPLTNALAAARMG